ncbi:acetylornithine deacetylase [Microbaculum marinum]|uniref:Acetylornithine deacetylase n=1 Tax=Microbaculum marinum TaxID=1764581 RepID=A0AAW9RW69_9HYPH
MEAGAIAVLDALVGFDTTSRRSNLELVDWVVAHVERHDARVRVTYDDTRTKANVLASFGPADAAGVVLSGHTDVVPVDSQDWSTDPFTLSERDGRLYGRGTADMKGFVACCLAAVAGISEAELKRPIHIALSYDEEIGCFGVPRLIEDMLRHEAKPALAIIGEPTGMRIGDRHRGYCGFRSTFTGKAAHSSDPSAGASAIYPASALVAMLRSMSEGGARRAGRTTFNVGRIDGGAAMNIVPNLCKVIWEFRPAPDEDVAGLRGMIEAFIARMTPANVGHATEVVAWVPPLPRDPVDEAIAIVETCGGLGPSAMMPFGTEAGFFRDAGIPALVCGPGSIEQAHQPDEWIAVEQIDSATRFLGRVATWASAGQAASPG